MKGLLARTKTKPGPKPGTLRSTKSTTPAKGGKRANLLNSALVRPNPTANAQKIKVSLPKTSAKAQVVRPGQIKGNVAMPSQGAPGALQRGAAKASKLI